MYKQYTMNQTYLPIELSYFLEPDHIVFLINDFVEALDLTELEQSRSMEGRPAYHPRLLIKALIFAYSKKTFSGRQIEKMMRENLAMKWLVADQVISYRSINRFRSSETCSKLLEEVFVNFRLSLIDQKMIEGNVVFIDGTKIEANANKYSFVWKRATEKFKAKLKVKEVEYYRKEIQPTVERELIKEEIDELSLDELKWIKEILDEEYQELDQAIENEPVKGRDPRKKKRRSLKKHINRLTKDFIPREEKYQIYEETFGQRNSFSKTDPDATFMRMKEDHMLNGQLKPGYNLQIATENQFVLSYDIYPNPTDTRTLIPFIESMTQVPQMVVADAGYGSQENLEYLDELGIGHLIKYNMFDKEQKKKYKNSPKNKANWAYDESAKTFTHPDGVVYYYHHTQKRKNASGYVSNVEVYYPKDPDNAPQKGFYYNREYVELQNKESEKLLSDKGSSIFARRKIDVEPAFGQLKQNLGFKRTSVRGKKQVKNDIGLALMALNMKKMNNKSKLKEKT